MLYVIKHGGNFVPNPTPSEDIIYIVLSMPDIDSSGSVYYFTDGHATDGYTSFYDSTMFSELTNILDWDSISAKYWGGSDNLDTKRKKQAELLVSNDLDSGLIFAFLCYNESAKRKLLDLGVVEDKIHVLPRIYY